MSDLAEPSTHLNASQRDRRICPEWSRPSRARATCRYPVLLMMDDPVDFVHPLDASHAYLRGQLHPSQEPLLAAYASESEATLTRWIPAVDLRYAAHPRAVFDHYRSLSPWRGTLVFIHGGYWQGRDKAQFRFLAPPFLLEGVDVVMLNYPLCPDVTLRELVAVVREGLPHLLAHLEDAGRGGRKVVIVGHSAGAHLAVEASLTNWTALGLPRNPVAGIVAISGIYDVTPLTETPLNDKLRLDRREAHELSPLYRVARPLPSACFAVGVDETPEFRAQSEAMHAAWMGAGGISSLSAVSDADHFSILRALGGGAASSRRRSRCSTRVAEFVSRSPGAIRSAAPRTHCQIVQPRTRGPLLARTALVVPSLSVRRHRRVCIGNSPKRTL